MTDVPAVVDQTGSALDPLDAFHAMARPLMRGWLHTAAFVAAIPAGMALIVLASGRAATLAACLYVMSLLLLFGTSASYHRLANSVRSRRIMQRLDHSMIYVLIIGTYVPMCLVALPYAWGIPVLAVVATCGLVGMTMKLVCFQRAQWLTYALYLVMGWVAIVAAPALVDHLSPLSLALIVAGGLAYTVGFPVLVTRRPNPWPQVFGYHEVWHLLTVIAAVLHFAAVTTVVA